VSAVALIANITNLFLYMLTATVFIEITFSLPGLGNLLLNAADRLDYPVIAGVALLVVVCFGLMNTLSGAFIYALDPRTR
jgi:peptide/nickel transport system permease protein